MTDTPTLTEPYYSDDHVTIYHGDCIEMLPELAFDVVVTDPPYGIGWKIGMIGEGNYHGSPIAGDNDTSARDAVLKLVGDELPWIVFGSLKAPLPPGWKQSIVFHKDCHNAGLVGVRRPWRNNWEPVFLGGVWPDQTPTVDSVVRTFEMAQSGYSGYTTRAGHPHAKPVDVMCQLIEQCPPGIVLDPFMGSGTTLRAAKDLGRKAIGIEVEEKYCEIAARRCAQVVLF